MMTPAERYINATGAAFDILQSESQLLGAIFGEVAMTCLVTMVVLLVAVNHKTKTPLAPFLVGCTVIINILAGWDKNDNFELILFEYLNKLQIESSSVCYIHLLFSNKSTIHPQSSFQH